MNHTLVAESIVKSFGHKRVLTNASLWATQSTITTILGQNGSGKTTLLKIITGNLRPDSGFIRYQGQRLPSAKLWQMARNGMFYVSTKPFLHRSLSCKSHLDAIAHHFKEAKTKMAVDLFRLKHLLARKPQQLSGGERRRVEIALAFARQPDCLIADEPFYGLMPIEVEFLQDAFRRLADRGTCIVLTGHEHRALLEITDEAVLLTSGTAHMLGDAAKALINPLFLQEYLGANFTLRFGQKKKHPHDER